MVFLMSSSNKIIELLTLKAKQNRQPLSVKLELLPACNLSCKMCYIKTDWQQINKRGGLIPIEKWLDIAKEMKEPGTLFLLITGGEVFMYPEFKRLYIELYKMGFILTINTNATLINEEVVSWLRKYPPKCISISLYGSNNDVYEKLCGQKGMFDRVNTAINLLIKNHISIECKTIFTPLNYNDLNNIWNYIKDKNINYESSVYSFPAIRNHKKEEQIRFNPKQAVECIFNKNDIMFNHEQNRKEVIAYLKKYEKTKTIPGAMQKGFTCSACNTACWINWQGKMLSCAMLPEPYTLPFKTGFKDAWDNLKHQVDNILLSTKCSFCEKRYICTVCPASAFCETGKYDGTSDYHCQMTNYQLKRMYKYIKDNHICLDEYNDDGERK